MTQEERIKALEDKLNDFINTYYTLNFPDLMVVSKKMDIRDNVTVRGDLNIDKLTFNGLKTPEPIIAKPSISGTGDVVNLKIAIDKVIDTLKNTGITL